MALNNMFILLKIIIALECAFKQSRRIIKLYEISTINRVNQKKKKNQKNEESFETLNVNPVVIFKCWKTTDFN